MDRYTRSMRTRKIIGGIAAITASTALALGLAATSAAADDGVKPGDTYEMCALRFPDGTVQGKADEPCADTSGKGITVKGKNLQNCTRSPKGDLCFTLDVTRETIFYHVKTVKGEAGKSKHGKAPEAGYYDACFIMKDGKLKGPTTFHYPCAFSYEGSSQIVVHYSSSERSSPIGEDDYDKRVDRDGTTLGYTILK